jgi:hypothetical protein
MDKGAEREEVEFPYAICAFRRAAQVRKRIDLSTVTVRLPSRCFNSPAGLVHGDSRP